MFTLEDVENIEGLNNISEEDYFLSLQRGINSLEAWKFQGSYGRVMMEAIKGGRCMLGESGTRDYWGNYIPSRHEVKEGTKGSRNFVLDTHGEDWVQLLEGVD